MQKEYVNSRIHKEYHQYEGHHLISHLYLAPFKSISFLFKTKLLYFLFNLFYFVWVTRRKWLIISYGSTSDWKVYTWCHSIIFTDLMSITSVFIPQSYLSLKHLSIKIYVISLAGVFRNLTLMFLNVQISSGWWTLEIHFDFIVIYNFFVF